MTSMRKVITLFFLLLSSAEVLMAKTGLPVPRYVSLRSAQINVRVGPGRHYPIEWVYVRSSLPVEIISEFDSWRKIKDFEGSEGWVHQSMLAGTRYVMVTQDQADLKKQPQKESRVVAHLEKDVVPRLHSCQGEWCKVEIQNIKGWIAREAIWGVYPEESIN